MKRLIKKNKTIAPPQLPEIGENVRVDSDPAYENLDMAELSKPEYRDGAVLVDTKNNKVYIGYNGETHAQLMEKYFNIPMNNNDTKLDIDSYVSPGVYLKNFLGNETIILYSYVDGAEDVITSQMPGVIVYGENWDEEETIMRLAKKE